MMFEVQGEPALITLLRSGLLTDPAIGQPVRYRREANRLWLQPLEELGPDGRAALRQAGVRFEPCALPSDAPVAGCWAEVIPCASEPLPLPPIGPTLFLLGADHGFLALAEELLRLGAVRQEWMSAGHDKEILHALRVSNPPYFTVLKASEEACGARVYAARNDRVWVELGFRHPLEPIALEGDGELLLISQRGPWRRLPQGPWTPLHERLLLHELPGRRLVPKSTGARLEVALRLEPVSTTASPRLWVLRGDGRSALEGLLAQLPAAVLPWLQVAGLECDGEEIVVLRSPDLGEAPPALELNAEAYAPRPDLPQLFIPVGFALAPPLTTELLETRVAADPDELVWLRAEPSIQVERAREDAFVPLSEAVDYLIDRASEPLSAWIRGTTFEFEAYEIERSPTSEPGPLKPEPRRRRRAELESGPGRSEDSAAGPAGGPAEEERLATPVVLPAAPVRAESGSAPARVHALERAMTESPPGNDQERRGRWLELALALAELGRGRDAALAFTRAAWPAPSDLPLYQAWAAHAAGPGTPTSWQRAINLILDEARGRPVDLVESQRHLSAEEPALPVHLAWLARVALTRRLGGDMLGLLRTRDGISLRIEDGFSLQRDVPSFVRGMDDGPRGSRAERLVEGLEQLRARYRETERNRSFNEAPEEFTAGYVDLLVQWGQSRIGDHTTDAVQVSEALDRRDPVHTLLVNLFQTRIAQTKEGLELGAPLSAAFRAQVDALPAFTRFKVERMWLGSLVLGGASQADPFRRWATRRPRVAAPNEATTPVDARVEALLDAEPDAARSEELAELLAALPEAESISRVERALRWSDGLEDAYRISCQEALLHLADHLDRPELVESAILALAPVLMRNSEAAIGVLARSARPLVRAGLGERVTAMAERLTEGTDKHGVDGARSRLTLATIRAVNGDVDAAATAFERESMHLGPGSPRTEAEFELVRTLSLTLARTSPEQAVAGVNQLMSRLVGVSDMLSTNSHYSASVVHFMESMVLALSGRDLTLGPAARAWLDEDERLFRTRMHRDLLELTS